MLTTRKIRSSRPADIGAGRLLAHLVFVIVMVVGVVFAHGGACAAVELAESAGHSVRAGEPAGEAHGAACMHRNLPPGHQHGTEQGCSAIGPAAAPGPLAVQEATAPPPRPRAGLPPMARDAYALGNLCVMRI
ncbi:hypothetical protein AB0C27_50730 [Nonomuraea sp. NPDC048882]|uniref:hypothetical protein n=1 Tax=unclassified Nonomuraea TaxID=2593643 RepID=UPI00340EB67F